jgi:hypothetical protein
VTERHSSTLSEAVYLHVGDLKKAGAYELEGESV